MSTSGTTEPTTTNGATATVAEFAATARIAGFSGQLVDNARAIVLDTLGVCLAALNAPVGRIAVDYAQDQGGEPAARIIGTDARVSPANAAFANGILAHALDFDDHKHLSTHTLPAALALGEFLGRSGAEVLEAYVVGREVGTRLGDVIEAKRKLKQGPTFRGWYRVGVVGPVAAAVSAGKLLGLDPARLAQAIGIAATSSAGLRRNQGTMAKALHAGNAARAGVDAALLASRGFTADEGVLEAPLGLVNALCLPGEADWSALERLGRPYEFEKKIAAKRFPACTPSHMPVAAALRIRAEHDPRPEDIAAIEADLHPFSLQRPDPQEAIATGFSLPYLVAVALVDGDVAVDQVSEARLHDPRVRSLMQRVFHDPEAVAADGSERVTVRMTDGRVLTATVDDKPDLHSLESVVEKFHRNADPVLGRDRAEELRAAVASLLDLTTVSDLVALTARS